METEIRNQNAESGNSQTQMNAAPQPLSPEENPAYQEFLKENIAKGKKTYNYVMMMFVVLTVVTNGIQLLAQLILGEKFGEQEWFTWALIVVPLYVIGFPMLALLLKKVPVMNLEKHSMKFWQFLLIVLMGCGICGVGSVLGIFVSLPILLPFGKDINDANALSEIMSNSSPIMRILVVGILAPIFEELIFRKLLIDHVVKYGEWIAVFLSGLMFGMFHGNFQQFFFATGLGMLFAYIYVRTGQVWYTILFHMVVNLSSSAITLGILEMVDLDKMMQMSEEMQKSPETFDIMKYQDILPGFAIYMLWIGVLCICCVAGIIILIVNLCMKKFYFRSIIGEFPKKIRAKAAMLNPGFLLYTALIIGMFVLYYVSVVSS